MQAGVAGQDDASALAAMAAVRAALGHALFTAEADAPVPAPTGMDEYLDLVDEHCGL